MNEINKKWSFCISSVLLFAALMVTEKWPAILSIAMAINLLSIIVFTPPKKLLANFWNNKGAILFSCSTLYLASSFLYGNNQHYLLERIQIKLPLILYAFVLPSLGKLCVRQIRLLLYGFITVITATSLGVFINYLLHFDAVNQMYLESKIMPTPINHIRFSLLVVIGIYVIYFSLKNYWDELGKNTQNGLILILLFLIFFLHIYSVRSGLLALYAVIGVIFIGQLWQKQNIKKAISGLLLILMVAITSFLVSPTMRNKLLNTSNDVAVIKDKQDPNFNSIATRVVSYKIAMQIWNDNKLIGCSQGDLWDLMQVKFKADYPSVKVPIIPHNQFLYYLAATGIVGLLLFCVFFYAPLYYYRSFRVEPIFISYLIITSAFMFEAMIESQLGVACTVVIVLIGSILAGNKTNTITAINTQS